MLATLGLDSTEALFTHIPPALRLRRPLDLPPALAEMDLWREMRAIAGQNLDQDAALTFLGAGNYDHFIPTAVHHLTGRAEFYTSYTPYQPEISQGILQATYEYQSLVCLLFGMDVSNASMYDGASALAEACLMACGATDRARLVLADGLHPEYAATLRTYGEGPGLEIVTAPRGEGLLTVEAARELVNGQTAALVVQSPNFFGGVESWSALAEVAHAAGALLIAVVTDPTTLGVLKSPGAGGADIVAAEGQALGNASNFGGPALGILAVTERLLRRLPGRIAGKTTDKLGRAGYVLTLQTREQHIRREKATSNICTNQALLAIASSIYLACLGPRGLREVATQSFQKAHYAFERITSLPGFAPVFTTPFFHEFAVTAPVMPFEVNTALRQAGIIGGLELNGPPAEPPIPGALLFCVTEQRTKADIDRLVDVLEDII